MTTPKMLEGVRVLTDVLRGEIAFRGQQVAFAVGPVQNAGLDMCQHHLIGTQICWYGIHAAHAAAPADARWEAASIATVFAHKSKSLDAARGAT